MKKAFTMIELIFVIVVLGILSSIAVSKMAVTRDDAQLVKGRSEVSAIRSAITLQRSKNMMSGIVNGGNPTHLDALTATSASSGEKLFDYDSNSSDPKKKLLDYPIYAKSENGGWKKLEADKYAFRIMNVDVNFTYNAGNFDCTHGTTTKAEEYCKTLTE